MRGRAAGCRQRSRLASREGRGPSQSQQPIDVEGGADLFCGALDDRSRPRRFRRPGPGRDGATAAPAPGRRAAPRIWRDRADAALTAPVSSARWRSLATRLKITPASGTFGPVVSKAAQQSGDRSPLAARVDDQHDRPAGDQGEFSGRARLAVGAGAVEQAHDPFAQHDLGRGFQPGDEPGKGLRPHCPRIEIDARRAARERVKGRIDEIGPGLGRGDAHAAPAQMPQQAGRHQCLAAPEAGAARISPRACICSRACGPGRISSAVCRRRAVPATSNALTMPERNAK